MTGSTRLLVRGGRVYDHDGDVHRPPVADILVEGGDIVAVGPALAADGVHQVVDAAGKLVVPGLINAHYHSHDTLCRGLFEELPLELWLLYTLPMGQNRSKEEVRARTLVGALESLRCGITTVQDMLGLSPLNEAYTDVVLQAYRDIGQLKLKYFNWDHPEPSAYAWQDWWSRFSKEGIAGDAAAATPEFGQRLFELTVERFVEMAREFRTIPIKPRVDHH